MIEIALEHPEEKKKYGRLNNFENAQDRPETFKSQLCSLLSMIFSKYRMKYLPERLDRLEKF